MTLAGRPGQKADERTSRAGKDGDAEMQDANAEADEEEQQEHGDIKADGEAEDAAHARGHLERETKFSGKVDDFVVCMNTLPLCFVGLVMIQYRC